ncbi:hypothetical protein C942_04672 [Photobacterium marinum]|uniref:Uncharacterized protein n=1 Tax=Photobacterium marinum TaxID=1056511 RepID=L8JFE7_9GAMM|nr:hypothetical protein [Photobacterium marinum]ELR66968.1 hypothetical protein C942_04672 [Photobacterium marinum]
MGFKKNRSRKTYSTESTELDIQQDSNVVPLTQDAPIDLESFVFTVNNEIAYHFVRYFYKGVPRTSPRKVRQRAVRKAKLLNESALDMRLIHPSRTEMVKSFYDYAQTMKRQSKSLRTIYVALEIIGNFVRVCDEAGVEVSLSIECAVLYSKHLKEKVQKGKLKEGSARCRQGALLRYLLENGVDAKESVHHFSRNKGKHTAYTRHEIKLLAKVMHRVLASYGAHVAKNTQPKTCILSTTDTTEQKRVAKLRVSSPSSENGWLATLSASALYLISLYTGINLTPLRKMRRSDIDYNNMFIVKAEQHTLQLTDEAIERLFANYRDYKGNAYELNTVKGRAKFNNQQSPLGFSKYARQLLETWLLLLDKLDVGDYLFPNLTLGREGEYISGSQLTTFADLIEDHTEAPRPVNTRFRKTKTEVLVTVTNDFIVAAHANNHSAETAIQSYSDGNIENKERKLAKSISALGALVGGMNKPDAISQAEAKFKDPITPEELERLRAKQHTNNKVVSDTPTGKCTDALGDKAQRQARELRTNGLIGEDEDIPPCMKFTDCLFCKSYAITTDVDDIWLLLSFQFLLYQMLSRPAINSMPSSKYTKLQKRVMHLIERLKEKNRNNFDIAQSRIAERELHPIWQEESDLNDMIVEA